MYNKISLSSIEQLLNAVNNNFKNPYPELSPDELQRLIIEALEFAFAEGEKLQPQDKKFYCLSNEKIFTFLKNIDALIMKVGNNSWQIRLQRINDQATLLALTAFKMLS